MKRIQRKRSAGWKKPANTVNVARPGKYGNPFRVGDPGVPTAEIAVKKYWEWISISIRGKEIAEMARIELPGKNLMCYCREDSPCHADLLLEIANGIDGDTLIGQANKQGDFPFQ